MPRNTYRQIFTPLEMDFLIESAKTQNDNLILRDREGESWTFGPDHHDARPEHGWGYWLVDGFPYLVLWAPGDRIVSDADRIVT